jgi:arylsulfatase A-like enzyme
MGALPSPHSKASWRGVWTRLGVLILGLTAVSACSDAPHQPRGVLLISIDSLRADHVSAYGYKSKTRPEIPTTPTIDQLVANRGVLFTDASSSTSWTLPSHLAMLTGRPDELHGVRALPDRLPDEVPMLQERLLEAGWRTAGFWSGPNLHPWFGFDRGFERYVDCSAHPVADPEVFDLADPTGDQTEVVALHSASHVGITGPQVVDAFDAWMDEVDKDEAFFGFVHLWDVHYDYEPPAEFDVFDPDYRGKVDGRNFGDIKLAAGATADLNHLIALYDGEIRFTDHNIRRILMRLDEAGRLDNTLVIITSDHGEAFGEHGRLGHKHGLHTEETHVPLLMRYPERIPAGHVVRDPVSLVDLAPTVLEFADLPGLAGQWGRSLLPLATAATDALPERPMPMELTAPYIDRVHRGARWAGETVIDKQSKMELGSGIFIYDRRRDPGEQRAIIEPNATGRTKRFDQARALWDELDASAPASRSDGQLPSQLEEDLSSAGYVTDTKPPGDK